MGEAHGFFERRNVAIAELNHVYYFLYPKLSFFWLASVFFGVLPKLILLSLFEFVNVDAVWPCLREKSLVYEWVNNSDDVIHFRVSWRAQNFSSPLISEAASWELAPQV
jgi:hypothetical protein